MLPEDLANYTSYEDKVISWLRLHRDRPNAFSTDSEAVISMLQPEKQTDRVFGLDSWNLEPVIARTLSLPRQHYLDLQQWKGEPAKGDRGACVKRIMENMDIVSCYDPLYFTLLQVDPRTFSDDRVAFPHRLPLPSQSKQSLYSLQMAMPGQANAVTVEEIDQSLLQIAAFDKRSSAAVQSLASSWKFLDGVKLLVNLYKRL
jgi:hypothetical protein